jgi:hypothetical protein
MNDRGQKGWLEKAEVLDYLRMGPCKRLTTVRRYASLREGYVSRKYLQWTSYMLVAIISHHHISITDIEIHWSQLAAERRHVPALFLHPPPLLLPVSPWSSLGCLRLIL